jgi:hypothetical protein
MLKHSIYELAIAAITLLALPLTLAAQQAKTPGFESLHWGASKAEIKSFMSTIASTTMTLDTITAQGSGLHYEGGTYFNHAVDSWSFGFRNGGLTYASVEYDSDPYGTIVSVYKGISKQLEKSYGKPSKSTEEWEKSVKDLLSDEEILEWIQKGDAALFRTWSLGDKKHPCQLVCMIKDSGYLTVSSYEEKKDQ